MGSEGRERTAILVVLLVVSGGSVIFWMSFDRPLEAPDWHGEVKGVSYSPSGVYSQAQLERAVAEGVIRGDLEQLSMLTTRVRTYTVDRGQDRVPYIAKELGLTVSVGIWLSEDRHLNEIELAKAVRAINDNPGVIDRVFVGNETVVRGELSARAVTDYILRVRRAVADEKVAIGTAEVWSVWLEHPELARASGFVGVHILPYWEGISADGAVNYIADRFGVVQQRFPDKPIVIAEVGWPSNGRIKKRSVPSPAVQAYFLRQFLTLAAARTYDYYVIEAFDQPWKTASEGTVGAFWGIWDAERRPKFRLSGPLTSFEQWPAYGIVAAAATFLIGLAVLTLIPTVAIMGYTLVGGIIAMVVSGALLIVEGSSLRYPDWGTLAATLLIVPAVLFAALLFVTETVEWAVSLWRRRRMAPPSDNLIIPPRVSIHVPTHNEPPAMVIQTLSALARLDYPNFEVIVLDNNTRDERLWRPVEACCRGLGPNFRFFHFDNVKGFKAGALNKALALTDPAAEYVAVLDSDYVVTPGWLRTVMPAFAERRIAVVQAPQDYRDDSDSLFKSLCYQEYTTFFRVGMVERNEHNAIIQHGTMCVIRRRALEEVGGWAEWCITEDTELGLRLFEAGYQAFYTPDTMGCGLMPDSYEAYKSQRYRWVYGAMQILKYHAAQIFTGKSRLTWAQRYHFIAGWLPWVADAFGLMFGVLGLVWTALMIVAPTRFGVPFAALSSGGVTLFAIKTGKTIWLHCVKVGAGFPASVAATVAGLALGYTVGKAVLAGLFTSSKPFLRTPKCEHAPPWSRVLRSAPMETALLIGTIVAITSIATFGRVEDPAEIVWVAALSVFAVPYASAFLVALGSTSTFGRPLVFRSKRALAFRASTIDVPAWGSWTIEDGDARVSRTA